MLGMESISRTPPFSYQRGPEPMLYDWSMASDKFPLTRSWGSQIYDLVDLYPGFLLSWI